MTRMQLQPYVPTHVPQSRYTEHSTQGTWPPNVTPDNQICLNAFGPGHLSIEGTLISVNSKHTRLNFLCCSLSKTKQFHLPVPEILVIVSPCCPLNRGGCIKTGFNCSLATCPRKMSLRLNMSSKQRWLFFKKRSFHQNVSYGERWLYHSKLNCSLIEVIIRSFNDLSVLRICVPITTQDIQFLSAFLVYFCTFDLI